MLFHTLNTMQGSHQMSFFKRYFIGPCLFFFLVVFAAKIYDSRRENKEREKEHGSPEKARCKFPRALSPGVTECRLSPPATDEVCEYPGSPEISVPTSFFWEQLL